MGVYIKGMGKPSDCQYCVMYRDGYCGAKGGFCRSEKGVDADCPIVEVVEVNESEIPTSSEIPNNSLDKDTNVRNKDCETCRYESLESYEGACDDCTDISGSPSNYEPKTELPPRCPKCGKRGYIRSLESMGVKLKHFDEYKWKCTNCNKYFKEEPKDEPQTEMVTDCHRLDEPQTDVVALDKATLMDYLINSVDENDEPVWTERHIDEILKDFDVVPKTEPQTDCAWKKGE